MQTSEQPTAPTINYKIGNERLIKVTENASRKLTSLLEKQGRPNGALRLIVKLAHQAIPDRLNAGAEKKLPPMAYMPFGAGPRVCIGNHFALMEAHVVLATLMQRVRINLASDAEIGTEPLVTLRPKGGVPVRVSKLA